MKTLISSALTGQRKVVRGTLAALLTVAALGGWAISTTYTKAAAVEAPPLTMQDLKPSLVGSYAVTGTDPDGKPYYGRRIVDISLAPSGALELDWDNGKQVGVAQIVGNVLAVSCITKDRTAILLMNINPDGSLSGNWSRRTDRGQKGTETWKKAS